MNRLQNLAPAQAVSVEDARCAFGHGWLL